MSLVADGVRLRCISCGRSLDADPWLFRCPVCRGLLNVELPANVAFDWSEARRRRFGVWRYRELLPLKQGIEPVTLGEGGTPLVPLRRLGKPYRAFVKFEGANPTGSFKDRGMTVGVTLARELGVGRVAVASTGNTAASAAAYAARAGLRCVVYLPRGGVARGKLAQAILHGAEMVEVEGTFDRALDEVLDLVAGGGAYPLNSFNPWRLEGQKTLAFELVDELGRAPDAVVVPVGNAGNIAAIWKGFGEMRRLGLVDRLPRMVGVQAEGASPIARAWARGLSEPEFVESPRTVASAIRIGRPVNWPRAVRAVRESRGGFVAVSDEEILRAQRDLARHEGLGVEPASAAALAGYRRALEEGVLSPDDLVVIVATGHALKDPEAILSHARGPEGRHF